jgi:two-component system cell cycle response regulator
MRYKILTVDDSKTVRIIVKKAFKAYDCDILEAGNGVEGLAVAAKEMPDLILLDVTMPVMDGVEMLTKLKADAALKGIPVMMLTAEGGRDHVLKIAKIGVRDYLVKPFKEDVLIEKAGRVIDLKPLSDAPTKAKSIFDPAEILIVEDKPAIVQQIQEGLKHTPWKVHGVATQGEAIDFCVKTPPDIAIVSLSLPDETAFALFRLMRTNIKTKYTPIFALVVKTETAQQQQAQTVGFSAIITKPIDMGELETKMAKAMNLDTSQRYYAIDGDTLIMRLPENCAPAVLAEAAIYLKPKFAEAVDAGFNKVVIDIHLLRSLHMGVIKLLFQAMQTCRELGMQFVLIGNPQIVLECKGFEDTRGWTFYDTLEEAKANFGKAQPAAQLAGA